MQRSGLAAQQVSKPIGILGGTFDPIHNGHLRLAQEVLEQCKLSEVRFIPAGTPPHRSSPHARSLQRLDMVRLALQGNPQFILDEQEIDRTDPCYTVDTLAALRMELGAHQPLCLLMGADAFLQLHTWHEWKRLFELAHIVVVQRAGQPLGNAVQDADPSLQAEYQARLTPSAAVLHESPAGAVFVLHMPTLEISATDIRNRCAAHQSIRYLTPDAVFNYIMTQRLYR
jgi:nicotinate-nucleotide adenylyltransferase